MSVHMDRVVRQAHPAYEDWPEPSRWRHVQFAIAVLGQALVILAAIFGIAFVGLIVGAAVGVDMAVVP